MISRKRGLSLRELGPDMQGGAIPLSTVPGDHIPASQSFLGVRRATEARTPVSALVNATEGGAGMG